ncbi:hypothetical protein PtrSN002B_005380 [Pyrenophora tritici-repentis]|uniref:Hamartin multi-domain protein n=2 Tax=Pyrenophora tritici-repentis TaxID=45151 RepID=A0A2W1E695_9PLEO|nr:uncharacterized protein PTRG_06890 [Pyrenophora tritici-repentis Pt-1C-BFP]KAA8614424.1 hypothetical protein PtrV1_11454 [Pyrenophora tritici-repentis]EDU49810.1 hypothetical protein PTRG_06890 [Pyrenophora tritici-repentis Pt-1C-BFP]KAF7444262.1 hypothetical protein A1F99_108150 [Pyrenophora tritici-repentis]KAF7565092.1 Hamartin multi-domain protein [Pyrenophora tritici-repentis]KAG9378515.1 hypothetical protein A1F94_010284 [Pyrenophora tritici-repentis]
MKFTTSAVLASTLALASARACPSPQPQAGEEGLDPKAFGVFRLFAIIIDGPYSQNSTVQFWKNGLSINVKQDGTCRDPSINYASFSIAASDADYQPGGLFLYGANPPIQAFVDRSGMGQGILKFSEGVNPSTPRNGERAPWVITKDHTLMFDNGNGATGFQACTQDQGKTFQVWLQGVDRPAGLEDCHKFTAQVWPVDTSEAENPNQCTYTYTQ